MFSSTVGHQFHSLAAIVLLGVAVGLWFDFYRVLYNFLKVRRRVVWILDLAFWLVSSAVVVVGLFYSNYGELRFYVFGGLAAGAGLYYSLLSRYCVRFFFYLDYGVILVAHRVIGVTTSLVKRANRAAARSARPVLSFIDRFAGFMGRMAGTASLIFSVKFNVRGRRSEEDFSAKHRNKKEK